MVEYSPSCTWGVDLLLRVLWHPELLPDYVASCNETKGLSHELLSLPRYLDNPSEIRHVLESTLDLILLYYDLLIEIL